MTKLFEQAVEAARALTPEEQDALAQTMLGFMEEGAAVYVLSDEENAAIDEGRAALERGEFATEQDLKSLLVKYRA